MPSICAVPGCRGNYKNGVKVSTFSFPKDEFLKKRWVVAIRRKDYTVTKYSSVCELHFKKSDIETEVSAYDPKTGRTLTAPLSAKRLKKGVIPSLAIPKYSEASISSREDPEEKRMRLENEQLNSALQKSLKSSAEIFQSEHVTEVNSDSTISRLTEGKTVEDEQRKKRKRKTVNELDPSKKLNGICHKNSNDQSESTDVSQNRNLSDRKNNSSSQSFSQTIQVKEEMPWEQEYGLKSTSEDKLNSVKIVNVESSSSNIMIDENASQNLDAKETSSGGCDTSFYKKPLKIDKRDEAFGKLVACEMSDLRENPELYLRTQQSILKILVEAHFEQMSSI